MFLLLPLACDAILVMYVDVNGNAQVLRLPFIVLEPKQDRKQGAIQNLIPRENMCSMIGRINECMHVRNELYKQMGGGMKVCLKQA